MEGRYQATINTTTCDFNAAVVEYPILNTNSLRHNLLHHPLNPVSIEESEGDCLNTPVGAGVSSLSGLNQFINNNFFSNDTTRFNNISNKWLYSSPSTGKLVDVFFLTKPWDYSNHSLSTYSLVWASPTQHIIIAMYEYMFRVSIRVGHAAEKQSFVAEKRVTVLIFESD